MKSIYFAGKFNLDEDKNLSLSDRLKYDFRSQILGSSKMLTNAKSNVVLDNGYIYAGPFYCEQASNGDFTSTDCNTVIDAEYKSVSEADIYFCLFDKRFAVGTIVELGWAIQMNKDIVIFYEEEESVYDIKSEYWFAILNAIKSSKKVKVFKFNDVKDVIEKVKEGSIFSEI